MLQRRRCGVLLQKATAVAGISLAALSGVAEIISGPGTRWGWWEYTAGLGMLRWATICGLAAVVISLAAVLTMGTEARLPRLPLAIMGLTLGLVVTAIPVSWLLTARSVPRIHDITTDTNDPPRYVAVIPLRSGATNPVEYGGSAVAGLQHSAYPEVAPLMLPLPPDRAYALAMDAVHRMSWTVVDGNSSEGRIEATDSTFWFGFKDDIVMRIRPEGNGSRLDVRSLSRVGLSDVGTNAKRITAYLSAVRSMQ
jgi:uncharacterized protein (DUF1499 family)